MKRREYDILWKGMLEEVFGDMLQFVFPTAEGRFNLNRGVEHLDKELGDLDPHPDKKSDVRVVDKLGMVALKNGRGKSILVHVEVQGQHDRDFARRMFTYYYRIFNRYVRPITSLVIFTSRDGYKTSDNFRQHYMGMELMYKYNTLYITDYEDEDLKKDDNYFALVLLVAKEMLIKGKDRERQLLAHKVAITRILVKRGLLSDPKLQAIFMFLNNYVLFEKKETLLTFKRKVDLLTGKKNTMGILEQLAEIRMQEGIAKGRLEERTLLVKNLLASKKFATKEIAQLVSVSVAFVNKIKKKCEPSFS